MNLYPIPFDFIDKTINISWCEIKWGYENHFITSDVLIKKAEKVVSTDTYSNTELELSFLSYSELNHVTPFFKELCPEFKEERDSLRIKQKWLFIILSWLWINRNSFENPLAEVEIIYTNFDYPLEIDNFIRYMPPSDGYDPSMYSFKENIDNLMNNWESYLEMSALLFKTD